MFDRILVVCVGNICRSPMGEALLARALADRRGRTATVSSAGIGALVGHGADETAGRLMTQRGLDLSTHRARQLDAALIRQNDLILVMESGHKKAVEAMDPSARGKVYRWGEWIGQDVPDPYQQDEAAFHHALDLIDQGLQAWLPKLG